MNGLSGFDLQEIVLCGACLSSSKVRVDLNTERYVFKSIGGDV